MGKQTKHKSNLSSIILQAFDSEDIPEDEGEGAVEGAQDFENAFEEGAEEEPEENGEESWSAFVVLGVINICGWLDNVLKVSWVS